MGLFPNLFAVSQSQNGGIHSRKLYRSFLSGLSVAELPSESSAEGESADFLFRFILSL